MTPKIVVAIKIAHERYQTSRSRHPAASNSVAWATTTSNKYPRS